MSDDKETDFRNVSMAEFVRMCTASMERTGRSHATYEVEDRLTGVTLMVQAHTHEGFYGLPETYPNTTVTH